MRRLILGTAGHIDHGKTALVRALTGVDTDRLKEEKARGITIELGFAELEVDGDLRYGVVDVPGHEGFVRTMVAGATGMDVVLLVVAADEGVMPQTREHLAIVRLLGVERLAVAVTKTDLVSEEWLELVEEDVRDLLEGTPFAGAPVVPTSARTGAGLDVLRAVLADRGSTVSDRDASDVIRLPVDRVFTVRGTGTVVTGTLWSGSLEKGERVRLEPGGPEARIRGLQVHGADAGLVRPGSRTAVALVGADVSRDTVQRGQTLVSDWPPSWMLTARLSVIPGTEWRIEHGQRVRVHAGTAEVMARCVVPDGTVEAGGSAWVQLRLEAPVVARAGDALVIRSYSPVTTIGGARVAEPYPRKVSRFRTSDLDALSRLLDADPDERARASVARAGWQGLDAALLPLTARLTPEQARVAGERIEADGGVLAGGTLFAREPAGEAERRLLERVAAFHREAPLRPGIPLEILRQGLPRGAGEGLAEAVIRRLEAHGRIRVHQGTAAMPDFRVALDPDARAARDRLLETYRAAGLAPPAVKELPDDLRERADLESLLDLLLREGALKVLDQGLYIAGEELEASMNRVVQHFGGRDGLTPSDFREVIPVSRKHLMPLLAFLDGAGITVRRGDLRAVPGVRPGDG